MFRKRGQQEGQIDSEDVAPQNIPSSSNPRSKSKKNSSNSKKGLARVRVISKMIHGIIKKSKLEITSLHVQHPQGKTVHAVGNIKLTNLVTGPIPLVGLRLSFKNPEGVALTWTPTEQQTSGKTAEKTVIQAFIEPLDLLPNKLGTINSEIKIRFEVNDSSHESFVRFVRHIIRSDSTLGTQVTLEAEQAEVKVYGMRFGGLFIEKEIVLGGLGSLDGALKFDDTGMYGTGQKQDNAITRGAEDATSKQDTQSKKKNLFSKRQKSPPLRTAAAKAGKQASPSPNKLMIDHLEIVGGHPQDGMQLSATLTLVNPARDPQLSIEPGELRLLVCIRDEQALSDNVESPPQKYKYGTIQLPPGIICCGSITLPPVNLKPGPNKIDASLLIVIPPPPTPNDSPTSFPARAHKAGQRLVAQLMQDELIENTFVITTPYNESSLQSGTSDTRWIADAFAGVRIEYTIPPLGERVHLLDGAELRVEGGQEGSERGSRYQNNFDISSDSLPQSSIGSQNLKESVARATLRNGFEADIQVHSLKVNICSEPLFGEDGRSETLRLGGLSSASSAGMLWEGLLLSKGHPSHVSLPMEINPDPRVLIEILRKSARMRNINLGNPLSELLEDLRKAHWTEAGFAEPPQSRPASRAANSSRRSSYNPQREAEPSDDLATLLANALGNLRVTAEIEAEVSIGDYRIPGAVEIEQRNLPIALSTATAAALLPLIGKPFVKALVDRAEVEVHHVDVTSMDDRGVLARVTLGLSNFGPLNADATFDEGLLLREPNDTSKTIAIINFDNPLSVTAGDETPIMADCRISPPTGSGATERFSRFINQLLRADTITLSVLANPLSISAGGIHFSAVLEKMISVMGLGGFSDLRMEDLQIVGETSAPAAGVSMSVAAPANSAQNTAIQISTIAKIHNAGDIHLRIAKLEVAIIKDDIHIGQASIDDVDLKAKSTASLRVKGTLYAPPAREGEKHTKAIEKLNNLISTLIAGKEAKVDIVGRRAWVPTSKSSRPVSLAWLDESLRMFKTEATIQWKGGIQIVEKIDVGKIDATFAARRGLQLKIDDIIAQYNVPFPIQFELQSIDASMEIMFGNKVIAKCHAAQDTIENVQPVTEQRGGRSNSVALPPANNTPTAPSRLPSSPLLRKSVNSFTGHPNGTSASRSNNSTASPSSPKTALLRHPSSSSVATSSNNSSHFVPISRRVKLSLKQFDLNVENDEEVTGDMISHIFETGPEGTDRIRLNGVAHVTVKTVLGVLRLSVPLGQEHKLDIIGLDGLRNSPIHYTDFVIESGNPKFIQISMNVQSHNPAQGLTLNVPDSSLTLGVYYKDAFVGDVILGRDGKGVVINPGPVSIAGVEFRYRPTEKTEVVAQQMLSKLFSGETCQLAIRGHKKSSINSALTQALRLVDVPIDIHPLGDNTILDLIRVQLGVSVLTSNSIDATYYINNPIGLPIDVLHLEVKAYHRSQPFGQATKTYHKEGVLTGKLSDGTPASQFGTDGSGTSPRDPNSGAIDGSRRTSTSSGNPRLQRFLIPPSARRFQGGLVVKLDTPLDQLVAAFLKERGSIVLDVDLRLRLDIGGYLIPDLNYRQKVPLEVYGLQGVARILRLI
ncbi:uncharacterized protein FA14DRAFT_180051 [Meira miltonrushii]|uniref:Uncharacterized protein n=1 Tax=Meira miltonrushii TaxID=1280837 RepID=A0A316VBP7_9BASI|nr:uncharacterized protein FA14DRAFT_180051 [Meira miltonrushii]PWN33401.1 hypothetical protein FA14DRAFT_180051 [Meira miltonrushii]